MLKLVGLWMVLAAGCDGSAGGTDAGAVEDAGARADAGAIVEGPVSIDLAGSQQNPCWSPDSTRLAFTNFVTYNVGPAALAVVAATGGTADIILAGDQDNVGLPGCWSATRGQIVYSSDEIDRDEVWLIDPDGQNRVRVTDRPGTQAFEPSLSPDGAWIVFESHPTGVDTEGSLWKVRVDGTELTQLTDGTGDDRQPNWSPAGDRILFQSSRSGDIDLWTMAVDGTDLLDVTSSPSEDTDGSWSPDGSRIVYSSDANDVALAELFVIGGDGGTPTQVTHLGVYAGAPAWSPDGAWIAFETYASDPDGSPGTTLAVVRAP